MNRIQILAPCKDCEKRQVNCHDNCTRYSAYKAQINKIKKMQRDKSVAASWSYK